MEPLAILRADPLDLLFENRNKSYGAYTLRKYYARRLMLSLGFILSLVVILSFFYLYFQTRTFTKNTRYTPDLVLGTVDLYPRLKQILPTPAKPHVAKPPASVELTTPLITSEREISRPMTPNIELDKHAIGVETAPGEEGGNGVPTSRKTSGITGIQTDSTDRIPEIYDNAELMPEFPGGPEGLKRYLQKNLHMPENNLEPGTEVKVIARFVVGTDGRVRDIGISQAVDEVFSLEVKRVISKMPDWKPGMQHNRKVAVYFNLPVNFMVEE